MNNLYFCIMKNNIHPILTQIVESLNTLYSPEEIKSISKIICEDLLDIDYLSLYIDKDIILSDKQKQELNSILHRLQCFEPIQYIVEKVEFFGRAFSIAPGVLIPRPETEHLVDLIVKKESNAKRILDVGTGSGCIAITLAKEIPDSYVEAWDVSEEALQIAKRNNQKLAGGVQFKRKDVLEEIPQGASFDLIVSNPPYITFSEREEMESNVLEWEPGLALFVPDENPLVFYKRIATIGLDLLEDGGVLYFEINSLFGGQLVKLLEALGYVDVELKKDFFQRDRFIRARK